ncbi:MAG: hypothetical protein OJF50_006224 [Nitrospira sp.]|nr:hypothetical protein [Nitrospira sp.]
MVAIKLSDGKRPGGQATAIGGFECEFEFGEVPVSASGCDMSS